MTCTLVKTIALLVLQLTTLAKILLIWRCTWPRGRLCLEGPLFLQAASVCLLPLVFVGLAHACFEMQTQNTDKSGDDMPA